MRFSGYDNDWNEINLSKLLTFQNGINADSERYGTGIKYISVGDIINNVSITYDCIKGCVDIDDKQLNNYLVEYGDILFQRSSETPEDIGTANVYLDNKPCTFGGFVIRGKKIGDYDPKFFNYMLKSPDARKKTIRLGAGAQHYNIGQESLKSLNLWFTSVKEQEKISEFLSLIDERIQLQNKIIEDKKLIMNNLMYRLFADCSQYNTLNDYIEFGKAGGTPRSTNLSYYNGNIPFLSISDISNQGKYIYQTKKAITQEGLENSSAWLVPSNSLILSMYASVGYPTINLAPLATSQAMYSMILKNQSDIDFLYYYLLFFQKYKLNSLLETGTQSNINADTVKSIKIPIFEKITKTKVISLLNACYNSIENEKDILNKYESQREYLLTNMFI